MTHAVMADAQFTLAKTLRPYEGFESRYQGQDPRRPLNFTENGRTLDSLAGTPGHSPELVGDSWVPCGSRVILWFPYIPYLVGREPTAHRYYWQIVWRLSNVFQFRNDRRPYHLSKQGEGVPDPGPLPRVVIPAGYNTLAYSKPEPTDAGIATEPAVTCLYREVLQIGSSPTLAPINPDGNPGATEQGITGIGHVPIYFMHEVQSMGDAFLLQLYRNVVDAAPVWDFVVGGADNFLSICLGNGSGRTYPDLGVYMLDGSAP